MSLFRCATKKQIVRLCYNTKRCLSTQYSLQEADTDAVYPLVKPIYPPGDWGDLPRKTTWRRYKEIEDLLAIPTVQGRLDYFRSKGEHGRKIWFFNPGDNLAPRTFEYQQDKTKTLLIEDSLPEIYDEINVDDEVSFLKPVIIDALLLENDFAQRDKKNVRQLSNYTIRNMLINFTTLLAHSYEHLGTGCLSENVIVQAFWDRYQTKRPRPRRIKELYEYAPDTVPVIKTYKLQESRKDIKMRQFRMTGFEESAEFIGHITADFQYRSEKMLPEFISRTDSLSTGSYETKSPDCYPCEMGQSFGWEKLDSKVGYNLGDPWEYGTFSVINPYNNKAEHYEREVGEKHGQLYRMGYGLSASFLWTVAQAYTQGFNSYIDVTYPFTTQTILTNGKTFSFHAYQLNTLQLWKCNNSNPFQNICWQIPEANLYDVIENGEVKGFNDDVFKNLIKFIVLEPVDRGYNLKPTIPPDSPDHMAKPDMYFEKEVIVIEEEKEIVYDQS